MSYKELIERALHGRSVNQAAKDLGMRQNTLNRYARGERLPDYDDALRLAHEAGIDDAVAFNILAEEAARKKEGKNKEWCARLGSNQQPLPSEGSTLSIELRAHRV